MRAASSPLTDRSRSQPGDRCDRGPTARRVSWSHVLSTAGPARTACHNTVAVLNQAGLRAKADVRENYTPGWRFNHWELKGVPVRLELGPRDLEAGTVVACRRDTLEKSTLPLPTIADAVKGLLDTIHVSMLAKATKERDDHMIVRLASTRSDSACLLPLSAVPRAASASLGRDRPTHRP